ncbi:MAG: hypothetical protein QOE79_2367 [Sphingomonadales bacterium]|jgi:pimeloyl-ACP methyl ester carboxylesterase|nr:hypothetical protein [Sphingomonadales bacterium]
MPFPTLRSVLLCALAACPAAAGARPAAVPLKLEPYSFRLADGTDLPAERGTFSVPEDRNDPGSRRIEIGFLRFRSTAAHPGNPIVYLAGGPGGSGIAAAREQRQPLFLALRRVADVIALDQRGVGVSNHIPPCTAERRLDPAVPLGEASLTAYYRETLLGCVTRWKAAGVAVNGYTTVQCADDLEDLRKALGARKIDLWGISYGTHLAFAAMRRHPRSIGRVALASAEGMDQTVKLPAHVDAAFARIERVAPGTVATMRRVYGRYDSEPGRFTLPGGKLALRADSFPLRMMAGILPKDPEGIPRLAGAFRALDSGRTEALSPLLYGYFFKDPLTMIGMPELMDVASGITAARLALVRRQAAASLAGAATNFPMPQLRGAVPGLDLGDAYRREIRSSIPTLLLSGDLDVRTPLEEQAEATAGLTRFHRILVRNGGHDLFEAHPAVAGILVDFFSGRAVRTTEISLPPPRPGR